MVAAGVRVVFRGLLAKPELNGVEGVCIAQSAETGRWTVRVADGSEFAFKESNLEVLPPNLRLVVGSASVQGARPSQEDRHVKIPDFAKAARALKMPIDHLGSPCSYLAVFDGHCGHTCSDFAVRNLHSRILKRLAADTQRVSWTDDRVEGMLRAATEELDSEFLAKHRTAADGSTVLVAFIAEKRCFLAWAGDSRALLCRRTVDNDAETVRLTEDHRPSNEAEAQRVRAVGGEVVSVGDGIFRVAQGGYEERVLEIIRAEQRGLGTIARPPVAMAVSRSIGDRDFKAITQGANVISATPEVRTVHLRYGDRFVVLVSDGVTDVMADEELVALVGKSLDSSGQAGGDDSAVQIVCGEVLREAIRRGSSDNVTAALVVFNWPDLGDASNGAAEGLPAKRRKAEVGSSG